MLSNERACAASLYGHFARWLVVSFAVSAGACSADVTRFDFPAFGLTENKSPTGALAPSSAPLAQHSNDEGYATPPRSGGIYGDSGRSYTPQSPPYSGQRYDQSSLPPVATPPPAAPLRTADRAESPQRPIERPRYTSNSESVEIEPGDSLYSISRKYKVSLSALIELNGLRHGSSIKPGQRLLLPAGAVIPKRTAEVPESHPPATHATGLPVAPTPGWEGRYTMKAGDSLYGIARQHRVTLAELQRVNGITEPTRVRIGTVLRVPGGTEEVPSRAATAAAGPAGPPPAQAFSGPPATPRVINATREPTKVASLTDRTTDAVAPVSEAGGKFRWPVRGRVIAAFGKRPDGSHNDGINLAVPQGTEVHAAEGGRVAYAGSELKGYGNLILIRHDNGWVSAYAHNEQLLVKRDDVVKRGQIIAKAGRTGTVDMPQLHFELRQGSKPVDPIAYLER